MLKRQLDLANDTDRPDTRQSRALLALAYAQSEANNLKREENRQRAISNRIEYLKLLQTTEDRGHEFKNLLDILESEVLQ